MSDEDWRTRRRAQAEAHAQALARRQQAESDRARAMIADFVAAALRQGPAAVPLTARSRDGRRRYRTGLTGWYLKRDGSVGVDTAGRFYVLSVPPSMAARLRGAHVEPSDPPLVLGAGGRDGESIDLDRALARVLATQG